MSKAEKLYRQMQNSSLNWRIEQVETVARHFGLTGNRPGKGGSHVTFRRSDGEKVTIPDHRPIKPIYIIKFIRLIEDII